MSSLESRTADESVGRWRATLALLLLVPAPTLGVLMAMWWEPTRGTPLGQALYGAAKVWILALPIAWTLLIERQRAQVSRPTGRVILAGVCLGAAIAAAILAGYWFVGRHVIDAAAMRTALAANGLDQPSRYLLLVATLTLFNSLLEEYVWRWFVYRQCERLMPPSIAIAASSLMFTAHHLLALRTQMGWTPTALACAGIFIGGCCWSGLYQRYRSIWPGYVSHILADAAVFTVGWLLLFGGA